MRDEGQLPATKADLREYATKADFDRFMTKADFAEFRVGLREELRVMFRPIVATLAHHTVELADIREHIKTKLVTRDEFHSRMDALEKKRPQ